MINFFLLGAPTILKLHVKRTLDVSPRKHLISSNKRRASNKRHLLISAASTGIYIEISASL